MAADPNMWGGAGWHYLHYVALNYPATPEESDKERYGRFVELFGEVLPCVFCRERFAEKLNKIPVRLDSRKDFFDWTVDMHNAVNASHGKPILTYEQAYDTVIENGLKYAEGEPTGIPMKYVMAMAATFVTGLVVGKSISRE